MKLSLQRIHFDGKQMHSQQQPVNELMLITLLD